MSKCIGCKVEVSTTPLLTDLLCPQCQNALLWAREKVKIESGVDTQQRLEKLNSKCDNCGLLYDGMGYGCCGSITHTLCPNCGCYGRTSSHYGYGKTEKDGFYGVQDCKPHPKVHEVERCSMLGTMTSITGYQSGDFIRYGAAIYQPIFGSQKMVFIGDRSRQMNSVDFRHYADIKNGTFFCS